MYKYKNNSKQDLIVPGVGTCAAGGEIESLAPIENPHFELVSSDNTNSVVGTEAAQPNAIVEATPVATETPNLEVK